MTIPIIVQAFFFSFILLNSFFIVFSDQSESAIVFHDEKVFHDENNVVEDGEQCDPEPRASLLLINTVNGNLHALDNNNQRVWSIPIPGGSFASSYHNVENAQNKDTDNGFIIPDIADGGLLYHGGGGSVGVLRGSLKTRELTERAPFEEDGLIYLGQKHSRLLAVDLSNGQIVHDSGSATINAPLLVSSHFRVGQDQDQALAPNPPLWLGRVDWELQVWYESSLCSERAYIIL